MRDIQKVDLNDVPSLINKGKMTVEDGWTRCEPFIRGYLYKHITRYYGYDALDCNNILELDDLVQESWFAYQSAILSFTMYPEKQTQCFIDNLIARLHRMIYQAVKQFLYRQSLYQPISLDSRLREGRKQEANETDWYEIVPCNTDTEAEATDHVYDELLHKALVKCVKDTRTLSKLERNAIENWYFRGNNSCYKLRRRGNHNFKSLNDAQIHTMLANGVRKLRTFKNRQRLKGFLDYGYTKSK